VKPIFKFAFGANSLANFGLNLTSLEIFWFEKVLALGTGWECLTLDSLPFEKILALSPFSILYFFFF